MRIIYSRNSGVIHPHPDFMLFATQNPPGLYGGRKVLSRAFRNRFWNCILMISQDELEIILRRDVKLLLLMVKDCGSLSSIICAKTIYQII